MEWIIVSFLIAFMFYVIIWQYSKLKIQDKKFDEMEKINKEVERGYYQ